MTTTVSSPTSVYRFAGFEFDPGARSLSARGNEIRIQRRPLDLLHYLVQHRERVVPREELLQEVWGARVGPQAFAFAVHALRKALSDDGLKSRIVKTVRGTGLQFIAAVEIAPIPTAARQASAPLLGRQRLSEIVREFLDDSSRGIGGFLQLEGEPGIGKTHAIGYLAALARAEGFRVFVANCAAPERDLPFSPWRQIVQSLGENRTVREIATEFDVNEDDLRWIAAPIEDLPSSCEPLHWQDMSTRLRLFDIVAKLFLRSMRNQPTVIAIDDLHRSDPASLALLDHLAPSLVDNGVALAVSFRDQAQSELSDLLAALTPRLSPSAIRHYQLDQLSAPEIRRLVEHLTTTSISPDLADSLTRRTEGNPFFTTLLVGVLQRHKQIDQLTSRDLESIRLPSSVYGAVLLQLQDLPDDTVSALELASAAGREFSSLDLEKALQISEQRMLSLLAPAIRSRVICNSATPGNYRFVHGLVQESILANLDPSKRASNHSMLARAIQRQVAGREWLRASELARHSVEAVSIDGSDQAVEFLESAADVALVVQGLEDVQAFLEKACSLAVVRSPATTRCRLLIKLGNARNGLGNRAGAHSALRDATNLANRAGLHRYSALAALAFAPDFFALETGIVDSEQVSLLRKAYEDPELIDLSLRSRLAARLGVSLYWSDEAIGQAIDLTKQGVALALESGDRSAQTYARTAERLSQLEMSDPASFVEVEQQSHLEPHTADSLVPRVLKITGYWILGDMKAVRSQLTEFAEASNQLRMYRIEWYEYLWKASIALMEGRFRHANVFQEQYTALGELAGDRNAIHSRVLQSFLTCLDLSELQPYEQTIAEMVEDYPRVAGWRAAQLLYLVECEQLESAYDLFVQLTHERVIHRPKRNEWYGVAAALAIAAARFREGNFARELHSILFPNRSHFAVVGYGSYCLGSVAHLSGLCCLAAGELEQARSEFDFAISMNQRIGAVPAIARVLLDRSALELEAGLRNDAKMYARQALAICERLGMIRLARKALRVSESS